MVTRIIVAGGRDFDNYDMLKETINGVLTLTGKKDDTNNIEFVSGTARGADTLGERFAEEFGYKVTRFPADWDRHGKVAGFLRNTQMAQYASQDGFQGMLIAFWDGQSKGTEHMISESHKHGISVTIAHY